MIIKLVLFLASIPSICIGLDYGDESISDIDIEALTESYVKKLLDKVKGIN